MINKKLFNNNYIDKKQFAVADNDVIINWLAFQKQENEEKINSLNTQIENKYYKISIDCINMKQMDSATSSLHHMSSTVFTIH